MLKMDGTDVKIYMDLSEKGILDGMSDEDIMDLIASIRKDMINEQLEIGEFLADNLDDNIAKAIIEDEDSK